MAATTGPSMDSGNAFARVVGGRSTAAAGGLGPRDPSAVRRNTQDDGHTPATEPGGTALVVAMLGVVAFLMRHRGERRD